MYIVHRLTDIRIRVSSLCPCHPTCWEEMASIIF